MTAYLDRNHRGWQSNLTDLEDAEIPLRDPAEPAEDELTEWAREAGYGDADWVRAEAVGAVVARILNEAEDEERTRAAPQSAASSASGTAVVTPTTSARSNSSEPGTRSNPQTPGDERTPPVSPCTTVCRATPSARDSRPSAAAF